MERLTPLELHHMMTFVLEMRKLEIEHCGGMDARIKQEEQALMLVSEKLQKEQGDPRVRGMLQTEKRRLEGLLRTLRAGRVTPSPDADRKFTAMYLDMLAIPRVKEIYVASWFQAKYKYLHVITDTLYGMSWSGSWHRIGRFRILIDYLASVTDVFPASGCIKAFRWFNLDPVPRTGAGPFSKEGLWQAPTYIGEDGIAMCYGTGRERLRTDTAGGDWPRVVSALVRYPEHPGQLNSIRQWPLVERGDVPRWYLDTFTTPPEPSEDVYGTNIMRAIEQMNEIGGYF